MLQISDLNVYYGESHILRNVDMSIAPGQMVGLIGRTGVGKPTLLKTTMALRAPRSRYVVYDDRQLNSVPTDKRAFPMKFSSFSLCSKPCFLAGEGT